MATWSDIDWAQPWLAPYRALGERAAALIEQGAVTHEALSALPQLGAPTASALLPAGSLRFVAPEALPQGEAYEAFIARTACVPTRHNLHDFFNGLIWLTWPALKQRLHEIQAQQIAQFGVSGARGVVRDAVTLFDENGALLEAPAPLRQALIERDWASLFLAQRAQWQQARLVIVGHALLEQLVQPRKPLCAHVWLNQAAARGDFTEADLQPKPFAPLPVLGVPGWWAANTAPSFYADPAVFRAPRSPVPAGLADQAGRKPSIDR
jgi:hypothetical protein